MQEKSSFRKNSFKFKKTFRTNVLFRFSKLDNFFCNRSVHYIFRMIKNWNLNLSFFLNTKVLVSFEFLNKSRLKNLFFSFIRNKKIWNEILKMMNFRVISFSPRLFLYENGCYFFNLLSVLLFDIYFAELDTYVLNLSYQFNSKRVFVSEFNFEKKLVAKKKIYLECLFPLKFTERTKNFLFLLNKKNSLILLKAYEKNINYVRYMNFLLLGVVGSKVFALKVKRKLINFINGNLHFDLLGCNVFSVFESQNFFLGYQIRCAFLYSI